MIIDCKTVIDITFHFIQQVLFKLIPKSLSRSAWNDGFSKYTMMLSDRFGWLLSMYLLSYKKSDDVCLSGIARMSIVLCVANFLDAGWGIQ